MFHVLLTEPVCSGTIDGMNVQRRLNSLSASFLPALTIVVGSAVFTGGMVILQAWFLSSIIDRVHLQAAGLEQEIPDLFNLSLVIILRAVMVYVNEQGAAVLSEKIRSNLREQLTAKLLRLGPAYIDRQRGGELTHALTTAVDSLDAYFSQYLPQLIVTMVLPVGILAVVFPIDTLSAVVLLLTAPLIPIFMILIGKTTEALTNRQYQTFSRMSAFFLDSLRGLTELKNLGRSIDHAVRLDGVSEQYRKATMRVLRISFLSALVLELAATLSVAVIAVEIGIRLLYGRVDFLQAFFLLVIAPEFYLPLRQLGARFHAGRSGVSAARRIFEILDEPEPSPVITSTAARRDLKEDFQAPFYIRFENVSFGYPGRELDAIHGLSFDLHSGETNALIGLNGSGKSTLAALLLRFIQPREGRILINETNIQEIPVETWRASIAWMNQKPFLFNETIRQNLLIASPHATDHEIEPVLEETRLLEVIRAMPDGLDTVIGENAYRLSGGQAQRLALARTLLKDAPLVVLDEPTSHLDALLEKDLADSLQRLRATRTVLVIAHRKDTANQADRILIMENGRLAGLGKPGDLQKSNQAYMRLFNEGGLLESA